MSDNSGFYTGPSRTSIEDEVSASTLESLLDSDTPAAQQGASAASGLPPGLASTVAAPAKESGASGYSSGFYTGPPESFTASAPPTAAAASVTSSFAPASTTPAAPGTCSEGEGELYSSGCET